MRCPCRPRRIHRGAGGAVPRAVRLDHYRRQILIQVLSITILSTPALRAASPDAPGDVFSRLEVGPEDAQRLFAQADAAIWIPDEGRFLWLAPEGHSSPSDAEVVARRVRAGELGRRFRPGPGRAYLLKEPATARPLSGMAAWGAAPEAPDVSPMATPFIEGFESGMGAWTLADNSLGLYGWGATTCEARGGSRSADAHRGGANNLTCSSAYPAEVVTQIRHTACESLAGSTRSFLDVWFHLESEADYDSLGFYYEGEDGEWYGYSFSGSWPAWFHAVFSLKQWYRVGDVTGRPCPRLLVQFSADGSEQPGFGARIDDLTVGSESPLFLTCAIQASPTSGPPPLDVTFTPVVTGASASATYLWSFGDAAGGTSTSPSASYRYTGTGDYQVRLRVTDAGVRAYANQTIRVTTGPACSVTCSAAAPSTAVAGTSVAFQGSATPTSCSGPLSYSWTFGDGGSSSAASPAHTYANAGTYTWTFAASTSGQTCTRSGSILVTAAPQNAPRVTVGSATGASGGSLSLPLSFAANGADVSALSLDLTLGSALTYVSASAGAAATAAGKQVLAAPVTGGLRLLVFGLNQTRLADGATANVVLQVRPGTAAGTLSVPVATISGSDGSGRAVTVQAAPGSITVSGSTGASTSLLVPVVLSLSGAGGSFYTSELTLTNRSGAEALLTLEYTASIGGGSGSATERLGAGRQLIVPDAIEWLRGRGIPLPSSGSRLGTLRVTSAGTGISATCRTATAVPEGRAGLAYPGVSGLEALTSGAAYLCGLRGNASDRSNVAVVNAGGPGDGGIRLRLTVRSGDPSAPASGSYETDSLPPGGWLQLSLDDLLSRAGLSLSSPNVFVKVERTSGSAPYYAYGVVNDNGTSDGSFVFPVPERALDGKTSLTLPVVVETSAFTTEVSLTNFGTSTRTLLLTYVASAVTSAGNAASQTLTLQPGEQRILPAFVDFLRALGTPGVPARGPTFAGALFVSALAGDVSGVVVGGRTSSAGGAGRYGLFYAATPNGDAADGPAWLFGLQQNAENRTNLALVSTGERGTTPVTLRIEIWNGDTGQLAATVEGPQTTLDARRFTQLDRVLQSFAPGVTHGFARVTRVSGTNPFLTYAVVNDGAEPGQRSGDGAFVPMQRE